MKDQYADPEAFEKWCKEGDYRMDEQKDKEMEQEPEQKQGITVEYIKELITKIHEGRKTEYKAQKTILDGMSHGDPNYQTQSHMVGYHKGQFQLIEAINTAIQ